MQKSYSHQDFIELAEDMIDYAKNTQIPILKEWCFFNNISYSTIKSHDEFEDAISFLKNKKEADLERRGIRDKSNTMCIFSLKQEGWRNEQEVTVKTDLNEFQKAMKQLEESEEDDDDEV